MKIKRKPKETPVVVQGEVVEETPVKKKPGRPKKVVADSIPEKAEPSAPDPLVTVEELPTSTPKPAKPAKSEVVKEARIVPTNKKFVGNKEGVQPIAGMKLMEERDKEVIACNDYIRMGLRRTLKGLIREYQARVDEGDKHIPTTSLQTITAWSAKYGWVERAKEYDKELEEENQRRHDHIMSTKYARVEERVQTLTDLLDKEIEEWGEVDSKGRKHNKWLHEEKWIGGESGYAIEIRKPNIGALTQMRGLLSDIAEETGGRKKAVEHSGKIDTEVIVLNGVSSDDI